MATSLLSRTFCGKGRLTKNLINKILRNLRPEVINYKHHQYSTAVSSYLESHEFVVGFWSPGVDLDAVLESDDQELDLLILDHFVMNTSLQVTHGHKADLTLVHRLLLLTQTQNTCTWINLRYKFKQIIFFLNCCFK